MIIIDRAQDIYDYISNIYGRDETIVFKREEKRKKVFNYIRNHRVVHHKFEYFNSSRKNGKFLVDGYVYIGGEVIPFIQCIDTLNGGLNFVQNDLCFEISDIPNEYSLFTKTSYFITQKVTNSLKTKMLTEFFNGNFNDGGALKESLDKLADKFKCPVFYVTQKAVVDDHLNPHQVGLLKNLKGFKVDPQDVYQKITMKMGEWSHPEEIFNVDDKHLLAKKGFHKMSFKKRGK